MWVFLACLEGDVVGVDVTTGVGSERRDGRAGAGGLPAEVGTAAAAITVLAAVQELHVVGIDLGLVALGPRVLVVPRAGLEAALDVDHAALLEVLAAELGELAVAGVPHHDVVVVGVLAALAAGILAVAIGGDGQVADGGSAGCEAQLRVAGEAADEHHAVERAGHQVSSSSAMRTAAGTSSTSSSPSSSSAPSSSRAATTVWRAASPSPSGAAPSGSASASASASRSTSRWRKTVSWMVRARSRPTTRAPSMRTCNSM